MSPQHLLRATLQFSEYVSACPESHGASDYNPQNILAGRSPPQVRAEEVSLRSKGQPFFSNCRPSHTARERPASGRLPSLPKLRAPEAGRMDSLKRLWRLLCRTACSQSEALRRTGTLLWVLQD